MKNELTRRAFLGRSGMVAVGFGLFQSSSFIVRAAEATGDRSNVFVFVLLRGGADGLSLFPPHGDAEYYKARPVLALPKPRTAGRDSIIDLDGYFGLHPALAPLKDIWDERRLAILQAVGARPSTRSHFDAQEFLETGTPGIRGTTTGWVNRCLAEIPGSDLTQCAAFSPLPPRAIMGPEAALVTEDLSTFEFQADGWKAEAEEAIREIYSTGQSPVSVTGRQAFAALDVLRRSSLLKIPPANGVRYPVTTFGLSLQQAAKIIKAGIGTRCVFVNFESQFDTHSNQLPSNANDYANLGQSLAAFYRDLGKLNDRVVVAVVSEFGRTVAEDGSRGTDHGTGGSMFLIGGGVRGGRFYGEWPGLEKQRRFEERDVEITTDVRDVFLEVARKHLHLTDSGALFPGYSSKHDPGILG